MEAGPSRASAGFPGPYTFPSSDFLKRLQSRENRSHYSPEIHKEEDIALYDELMRVTGSSPDSVNNEGHSLETVAKATLDHFWGAISTATDAQKLIREAELRERLLARSRRQKFGPDTHGREDEVLAKEIAVAYGEQLPAVHTTEDREAAYREYLDRWHGTLQDPRATISSRARLTPRSPSTMANLQAGIQSLESSRNDGIGRENLQYLQRIRNSLATIQSADDRIERDLDDIQKMVSAMNNMNLGGFLASLNDPSVDNRARAFDSMMDPLISTLESISMPQIEGSVVGDFPKMLRQMSDNIFKNMRARFPTGVPTPPQNESDTVTLEILEEAMREEFFADDSSSQEGIYKELVSTSSIRLLTFGGTDGNNCLCFSLDEVDLQDYPEFAALSYVWHDPRAPLYQKNPLPHRRKHEIVCNGKKISVSGNLFNALHTIFLGWEGNESPLSGIGGGRIWIDQLCINQQDVSERSQQVAFMDVIYQKARRVVAWLGPDDSHTLRAISVMERIGRIPRNTYIDPGYDVAASLREFSETDLISLMSFFASAYFQRVWIVQEVVFAKEIRMLCGRHTVSYQELVKTSSWLFRTGAWSLLSVQAASFQTPISNGKQAVGKTQPRVMPMGLRIQHNIRTHVNNGKSKSEPAKILLMARELQATDLRDKFYAMMGLAKQAATRLQIDINLPTPDYGKSLEAVTCQFARAYIRQRRSPDILLFVEDASYRRLQSLPSWVPDFSTPQLPRKFSDHLSRKWNAGSYRAYTKVHTDGSLVVEGRLIGSVNGVATPFSVIQEKKDWSSMFELTHSLFFRDPAPRMQPDEQLVRILTCQPQIRLEDRVRHEFADWLVQNLHSLTQASLDPVSSNAAILAAFRNVDELLSLETSEAYKVDFEKFADMRAALYDTIREGKATEDQGEGEVNKGRPSCLIDTAQARIESMWKKNPHGPFPKPAYVREALRSLYSTKDEERPRQVQIESNARRFRASIGPNIDARVLFTTDDGYLGLGSQSTRVGDEVWIISGVKVPVILRKRGSMVDRLYRVVGQCFVPHAMLGETVGNDQGPPSVKIRML
jgi:hypothetical protein